MQKYNQKEKIMTKSATKMLSITLCLLLVLLAVAVVVLGLNGSAPAYAAGTTAEGGVSAPATPAPTFTAIAGSSGYANLYDGSLESKLCVSITTNPNITFQASDVSTIVTAYKIYTGNDTKPDHTGRNPKSWKLQGSNDNTNWTDIHVVTNDDKLPELDNQTGYNYTFENTTPYWYYKITFTERQGVNGTSGTAENDNNLMQISEIEFTATANVGEIDTKEELVAAFTNGGSYKLIGDVTLTSDLAVGNKFVSLDLNGYVISGNKKITIYAKAPDVRSTFILNDSRPTATHTNASLPAGGVIDCTIVMDCHPDYNTNNDNAYLYANGGTVTKPLTIHTGYSWVDYMGGNTTTFAAGMTTSTNPHVNGGFYYSEVASTKADISVRIDNKKVLYKNGDTVYATQIVKSGDKATIIPTAPTTAPETGLTFVDWYSGTQKYDFSQTVTADTTVYAMWLKEVATANDFKSAINSNYSVKLTTDIVLDATFVINNGKASTIDLNGHVISFTNNAHEIEIKSLGATSITLIDSNPTATHENTDYPVGGYITKLAIRQDLSDSSSSVYLYANGGTIGSLGSNSMNYAHFYSTSPTPTVVKYVNANYIDLKAGTYYYNESKLGSPSIIFMNGDNFYAKVATSSKIVAAPAIEPTKEGYTFVGWYNGNTAHDFTKELTSNVTLTAKWVDSAAPVITGVDADSVYCTTQEVTVTDDSSVTVTVDGTEVTLTSGKFNLDMSSGTNKTIVATDAANNATTLVVTYGHHFGDWIEKIDEDCSNDGTLGHKICADCHGNFDTNGVKLESLVIPACHVYGTVGYTWADDNSTCTATRVCSRDSSHVETETATSSSSVTQTQSCTNDELTTYVATFTNTVFVQQTKADVVTNAKHGHNYGAVNYSWTSDNLKCTATRVCSHDDSHVETETVNSTPSVTQAQSCTNAELTTYVATFTNSVFAQQTKADVQTKSAAGHNLGALANEVAATCTENGVKAHADCSVCNKHFDATGNEITDLVIPALGHNYGEWVDEVGATTTGSGLKGHKDCDTCNKHFDDNNAEISDVDLVIEQLPAPPAEEGLSGGAIAGIVIACVVFAGIVAFAIVWFVVKKKTFADIASIFRK